MTTRAAGSTAAGPVYDTARQPDPIDDELRQLVRFRGLVALWARRNITLRYKRSLLGAAWTVLEPLAVMSILAVVFSAIFRFELPNYPVYVLSGWVMWDFFGRSTSAMASDVQSTREITSRFRLPRSAFLVASVASYLFNWCLALAVLAGVMLVFGHPFSAALVVEPLAMLLVALFAFGVGCIVSTLATAFYDFGLVYSVLLTMWFYATPFIYPLAIVPQPARPLLLLNPLTHLLVLVRAPIYEGRFPSAAEWLTGVIIALMAAMAGALVFTRARVAMEYRA
jgi:ABC-type polysaccharide/polyol phosphate export permease